MAAVAAWQPKLLPHHQSWDCHLGLAAANTCLQGKQWMFNNIFWSPGEQSCHRNRGGPAATTTQSEKGDSHRHSSDKIQLMVSQVDTEQVWHSRPDQQDSVLSISASCTEQRWTAWMSSPAIMLLARAVPPSDPTREDAMRKYSSLGARDRI